MVLNIRWVEFLLNIEFKEGRSLWIIKIENLRKSPAM